MTQCKISGSIQAKNQLDRFDTIPACDEHTDGQTHDGSIASRGKNPIRNCVPKKPPGYFFNILVTNKPIYRMYVEGSNASDYAFVATRENIFLVLHFYLFIFGFLFSGREYMVDS